KAARSWFVALPETLSWLARRQRDRGLSRCRRHKAAGVRDDSIMIFALSGEWPDHGGAGIRES
ncbi:hypothetical protein, partial [Protofrankia sp. BMG5.30]|uniref:hypothetical protein n=1 Tax=Protofrankia sp. BMG5.30 TaxID=1834514 RepID=UPI001C378BB1